MPETNSVQNSILEGIGGGPLIRLRNFGPENGGEILVKVESGNPTGNMKDRPALAMIEAAERDGRLQPGDRVVEYTGGSTGVSLALVCAVKGYALDIVTSDAFSLEKRNHMQALGANLTVIPSDHGGMDEALTRNMIEAARVIQREQGGYWTDQLNNTDQLIAYRQMGEEIWQQSAGGIDGFVHSVGTAASLRGMAEVLRGHNPDIHITAVEPSESAVLSGGTEGSHRIEGIGAGFVVPLWQPEIAEEVVSVSSAEAMAMARRLAKEEALFAGTSTGSNVMAAIDLAGRLGPSARIVTIMVDSGMKYLSTEQYGNG